MPAQLRAIPSDASEAESPALSARRPTDAVLVAAARAGEAWAQEALFRRHAPLVMGLAHRLLGSDTEIDDVAQQAYLEAFRSLDRLKDPQAFESWLAGIVVRCVHRMLRWRRLQNRLGLRPGTPVDPELSLVPNAPPDVVAELQRIYRVLDAVSAQASVVLVLRRVDGYSIPEIAAMLQCSASTVKRRLGEADAAIQSLRVEVQ